MKKVLLLFTAIGLSLILVACGSSTDKDSTTDEEVVKSKLDEDKEMVLNSRDIEREVVKKLDDSEDIWTYYDDATHEETWEGMKFNIEKVVVSDNAPGINEDREEVVSSAVGIKMTIENTTEDKVYTTYPDMATLVTSTGEQIEADMYVSDRLGGDIHEGVIKQGDIYFYLERGGASDIEWIKLNWNNSYDDPDGDYEKGLYQDLSVKIQLK